MNMQKAQKKEFFCLKTREEQMTTDEKKVAKLFQLKPKQVRIIEGVFQNELDQHTITYSHSTLCQTSLPFKDMGEIRKWKSRNGDAVVLLSAGEVFNPEEDDVIELGLPYGAKARLILMYLNSQAIKTKSPEITVEDSLYAFIKKLGIQPDGREYKRIKDQLARLAAAHITIGRTEADGSGTTQWGRIVDKLNVFFPKDGNQRLLWANTVRLSQEYFESLSRHAVPLDENALNLLRDSALELDLYAMLAERLHRIPENKPQFVPWAFFYQQYGSGYSRIRAFRANFLKCLQNVQAVYPCAKIEETLDNRGRSKGITLFNSHPPVIKRNMFVLKSSSDEQSD
jgi:Plasmid encoded RepA protein